MYKATVKQPVSQMHKHNSTLKATGTLMEALPSKRVVCWQPSTC